MPFTPGQRIGPFEVLRSLGAGGMGTVFLAYDTRLDRRVALKLLTKATEPEARGRLLREARAAARLQHANIASLYDVIEHEDVPVLVMEYVEGESLSAVVDRGPLDIDRALAIGGAIADALAHAHGAGIVHGDVKPANIIVTKDGGVKLLDLGVARVIMSDPAGPTRTVGETSGSSGPGTPAYMAPEQLSGRSADTRTDIYSTGVLLYELVTGERPYHARDWMALALAVSTGRTPRAAARRPEAAGPVDDLIARAMAHNADARFQTAAELRDNITSVRDSVRTGTAGSIARTPAARWRQLGTLAAISAVIVVGILFWTRRGVPAAPAPIAVLPALNLSGDADTAALGAGLVSVLIDNLSAAPAVTIATPAAVATYRGLNRDLPAIGRELGAGYVVDLSLRRAGTLVHLDGQLIRTGVREPIWRDSLDGDALAIHRQVVDHLATALEDAGMFRRRLTSEERQRLRRLPTSDADALLGYARGTAELDKATDRAGADRAIEAYQQAVARDTNFALAYAGLSQAYGSMYTYTRDGAWVTRSAEAASRALTIDPNRAPVHASLARVYFTTGQLQDAEQHARLAVGLASGNDDAHRLLGRILAARGDVPAGIAELNAAISLRPEYWLNYDSLGRIYFENARYEEAIPPFRRVTELRPDYSGGYQTLGTVLHFAGRTNEAIGNYEHALRLGPVATAYSNLAFSYYATGRFKDALANYEQALKLDATSPASYRNIGDTYERLGDNARASRAFEEAIARAEAMLKVNPNDARLIAQVALCEAKLGRKAPAKQHAMEAAAIRPADSDVIYKLAVVQAKNGDLAAALDTLGRAFGLGYPRAFAREDFDIAMLWDRADFKALVAEGTARRN